MGYYVTSVFAVSPNDKHSYFVYFIPGHDYQLSTAWVDDWVHLHFSKIAQRLGPMGVIVSPPRGTNWEADRIGELILEWPFTDLSNYEDDFLHHGQMPFLLLSRSPLQPDPKNGKEGIAINLAKCANEKELAQVFDTIITGIRKDDLQYIVNNFPLQEHAEKPDERGRWIEWSKILELKPNVFGIGVNLNAAMDAIGKKYLTTTDPLREQP